MLRSVTLCFLALSFAACGPLTKPGSDGGSNGPWVEVPLSLTGVQGEVQRLATRPGEVWALVGHAAVVRSTTGRFELLFESQPPSFEDFTLTPGGRVAMISTGALMTCRGGCAQSGSYDEYALLGHPLSVCSGGEALHFLTGLSDGGTTLFSFDGTSSWARAADVPVGEARQCAVATTGTVFVAGRGAVGQVEDGGVSVAAPVTTALNRPAQSELWTLVGADALAFAVSAQGAGARSDGWSALPALSGAAAALAVRSPTQAVVFGTASSARFDGTAWRADVVPATLSVITAATYGSDGALYVGGSDSSGAPRSFDEGREARALQPLLPACRMRAPCSARSPPRSSSSPRSPFPAPASSSRKAPPPTARRCSPTSPTHMSSTATCT